MGKSGTPPSALTSSEFTSELKLFIRPQSKRRLKRIRDEMARRDERKTSLADAARLTLRKGLAVVEQELNLSPME